MGAAFNVIPCCVTESETQDAEMEVLDLDEGVEQHTPVLSRDTLCWRRNETEERSAHACKDSDSWVGFHNVDTNLNRLVSQADGDCPLSNKSKTGELYDCIDIYKQPAFDHPLLKNHTLQLKPSSLPNGFKLTKPKPATFYGFNDTCPSGTILIERSQKPDNFHARSIDDRTSQGHYYAIFETTGSGPFYGAHARMGTYRLPNLLPNQVSSSTIYLYGGVNGPDNELNVMEAGWHVAPFTYNDNIPRFFIYWTSDGYENTGCVNLLCPGFVRISSGNGPGTPIVQFSTYNGEEKFMDVLIAKDPSTSNWWVWSEGVSIGYFPKELFPKMDGRIETVQMGGHVFSSASDPSPPMGSGHPSQEGRNKAAYFVQVQLVDSTNSLYNLVPESIEFRTDIPDYYDIGDYHNTNTNEGYAFAYGGVGGFKK
ncbi:protein neprosin-like [Curcuma longa]|uniref:protein neprosin-like n=1 Tax=Curcuma longa TaxID=136217 RepID=UPI003D9EDFBF